jgi:transposase
VAAFAATTRSQVAIIAALNAEVAALAAELAAHFETHPDADIYLSLPGIGVILGARVVAEFGDDPNRYDNAKSRKNCTSPVTRASGNRSVALARFVRPRRLADAVDQWAFCSLNNSPGARATTTTADAKATAEQTAWAHRPENSLTKETKDAA